VFTSTKPIRPNSFWSFWCDRGYNPTRLNKTIVFSRVCRCDHVYKTRVSEQRHVFRCDLTPLRISSVTTYWFVTTKVQTANFLLMSLFLDNAPCVAHIHYSYIGENGIHWWSPSQVVATTAPTVMCANVYECVRVTALSGHGCTAVQAVVMVTKINIWNKHFRQPIINNPWTDYHQTLHTWLHDYH